MLALLLAAALGLAAPASTVGVEIGGRIRPLAGSFCGLEGDRRFALSSHGELSLSADGLGARADLAYGDCARPSLLHLVGVGLFPSKRTGAEVDVDRDRLALVGPRLSGLVVWWRRREGGWSGAACQALAGAAGRERCEVSLAEETVRGALRDDDLTVLALPAGSPLPEAVPTGLELWSARGATAPAAAFSVPLGHWVLDAPPVHPVAIDGWRGEATVPIHWPGAVASVSCPPERCALAAEGALLQVSTPTEGASLRIQLALRPDVALRTPMGLAATATIELPVARCQLRPLLPALLGGLDDHRLPLALEASCPRELGGLAVETVPPTDASVAQLSADGRRLDLSIGHVPAGSAALRVKLFAGATRTLVGATSVRISEGWRGTRALLLDPELGELDSIPTNREVRVQLLSPDASLAPAFVPQSLPGYYTVQKGRVQGLVPTGGTVPVLVGYRPAEADLPAAAPSLVVFSAEPGYRVRDVSVPLSLAPEDPRARKLVQLICRGADGAERRLMPGETVNLPFASRHSCRLLFDRSVLRSEDGPQRLRITLAVTHPDATPAAGGFSKTITLRPTAGIESVWIEPATPIHPFDHLHVSLAQDDSHGFYGAGEEATGVAGQEETIIFGNDRLRLYGSATIPTGLYRLTGPQAGALNFSAGALLRVAALDRDGREFPFDFESGIFGTGLSQQANLSVVTGFGITVPILNANQPSQASLGIHAWLEYAPTIPGSLGEKLAFIFGPSVSVGDFGTNF